VRPLSEDFLTAQEQNKQGKMIIFVSVNLKKILKKRRAMSGSVPKSVLNAMHPRSGAMAMYLCILMEFPRDFGLKGSDAPSAARLSGCVLEDFSQDSRLQ
jgi:hypothetical protein